MADPMMAVKEVAPIRTWVLKGKYWAVISVNGEVLAMTKWESESKKLIRSDMRDMVVLVEICDG